MGGVCMRVLRIFLFWFTFCLAVLMSLIVLEILLQVVFGVGLPSEYGWARNSVVFVLGILITKRQANKGYFDRK